MENMWTLVPHLHGLLGYDHCEKEIYMQTKGQANLKRILAFYMTKNLVLIFHGALDAYRFLEKKFIKKF